MLAAPGVFVRLESAWLLDELDEGVTHWENVEFDGRAMNVLRNITLRHWVWIHFKVALGIVWPVALFFAAPAAIEQALGFVLWTIILTTGVGGLTSIVGIVMSAQPGLVAVKGIGVELAGLVMMFVGPFCYWGIQVYLMLTSPDGFAVRFTLICYAYAMCAAVLCRIVIVGRRYKYQQQHGGED